MGAVLMTIYPDDTNKLVILASIGKPTQLGQCLDEWNLTIISIRMMMIIIINNYNNSSGSSSSSSSSSGSSSSGSITNQ